MKKCILALLMGVSIVVANLAFADTSIQGHIGGLEIIGPVAARLGILTFEYRSWVTRPSATARHGHNVNSTEANYSALVAAALAAKTSDGTVTLHVALDSQGYCHLEYMNVQ